jgi:hypothetical protein
MLALVSITHSITIFPAAFMTAIEVLSLCTSIPIYLLLVIKGCSFLEELSRTLKTYSKRGALYIASRVQVMVFFPSIPDTSSVLFSVDRAVGEAPL